MRRIWLAWITGIFVLTVGGACAWFRLAPPASERLRFELAAEIPGWRFVPEPVSETVQEILATTNLVNGMFVAESGERVTGFAAEWRAEDSRSMSVVQHTPDICWVGAGWVPVALGQPDHVDLPFEGRMMRFECRVFGTPNGERREVVVWCTLLGGEVLEESGRWEIERASAASRESRYRWATRRVAGSQFLRNVGARRSGDGQKQFVRLSGEVSGRDWEPTLRRLERFSGMWLRVISQGTAPM